MKPRRKALPKLYRKRTRGDHRKASGKEQRLEKVEHSTSFRPARAMSVCDDIGVSSVCLQQMGMPVNVTSVECDAACRDLTEQRFPKADSSFTDVRHSSYASGVVQTV